MASIGRKMALIGLVALAMIRPVLTADAPKFQVDPSWPKTLPNSWDKTQLGRAADMVVDPATNELFVADGYYNHRVIVFDAATGAFKRMWGAYGKPPTDEKLTYDPNAPPPPQFSNPVHGIRLTKDGLVFVSDRGNNRAQVFRKDGTFVREYVVLKDGMPGSVGSTMLWPDAAQSSFIASDDPNGEFHAVPLSDGATAADR